MKPNYKNKWEGIFMLLDKDSLILYSTCIEKDNTLVYVFLRSDDGLFIHLDVKGQEFFKQIDYLSIEDDLHKGYYPTVATLNSQCTQAFKEFTGCEYEFEDLIPSILFHLLSSVKYLTLQDHYR